MTALQERWIFICGVMLLLGLLAVGFAQSRWTLLSTSRHWLVLITGAVAIAGLVLWLYSRLGDSRLTAREGLVGFTAVAVAASCWIILGFLGVNVGLDPGPPRPLRAELLRLRSDRNLRYATLRFEGHSETPEVLVSRELDRELQPGMRLLVPIWPGRLGTPWFRRADVEAAGHDLLER
jgi:hypothetical protein